MVNADEADHYQIDFVNSLIPLELAAHDHRMKIGTPRVLIRNLKLLQRNNGTR